MSPSVHHSSIIYFAFRTTLRTQPSTGQWPYNRTAKREQTYSANPFCTKGINLTQPNWMPNSLTSNVVLQRANAQFMKDRYLNSSISETEVQSGILDAKSILQCVERSDISLLRHPTHPHRLCAIKYHLKSAQFGSKSNAARLRQTPLRDWAIRRAFRDQRGLTWSQRSQGR
jgi:hypothetical protein